MTTDRTRLKNALDSVDYPADKDQLLTHATGNNADTDTLKALRSIQPISYANFDQVIAATPLASGESAAEKAEQHRQKTKSGVSETMIATPNNPIVEELGENRGS